MGPLQHRILLVLEGARRSRQIGLTAGEIAAVINDCWKTHNITRSNFLIPCKSIRREQVKAAMSGMGLRVRSRGWVFTERRRGLDYGYFYKLTGLGRRQINSVIPLTQRAA